MSLLVKPRRATGCCNLFQIELLLELKHFLLTCYWLHAHPCFKLLISVKIWLLLLRKYGWYFKRLEFIWLKLLFIILFRITNSSNLNRRYFPKYVKISIGPKTFLIFNIQTNMVFWFRNISSHNWNIFLREQLSLTS